MVKSEDEDDMKNKALIYVSQCVYTDVYIYIYIRNICLLVCILQTYSQDKTFLIF